MQKPTANEERPLSARQQARERRDLDLRDVLGMRHLPMVTIDLDAKPEEPKAATSE
jgi:hypothetical protein